MAVGLAAVGLFYMVSNENGSDAVEKIPFKTTHVVQGDLLVKISATGVVEPNFQVEVKSKASGEVLTFPFEEGDVVQQGQLLLQLDKSDEIRNVALAQADLASAQASLKKAKSIHLLQQTKYQTRLRSARSKVLEAEANLLEAEDKLQRQTDLFQKKFASQEALDQAITDRKVKQENLIQVKSDLQAAEDAIHDIAVKKHEIELAEVAVLRSKITLTEVEERLQETEIFSPISGILIDKLVQRGQIISSGISNVSGGTALSTIADMSRLFIIADVDEADIGSIRVKQPVWITTDAFPDKRIEGIVRRIAPKGDVENSITTFKVKIEILGDGKAFLKPMMSANVDIISKKLKDVLNVPREAIIKKEGKSYAAILENNLPKEIPVTTGIQNPIHVEIVSGLEAGQEVLVGDWEKVLAEYQKGKNKMSTIRKMMFILRSSSK